MVRLAHLFAALCTALLRWSIRLALVASVGAALALWAAGRAPLRLPDPLAGRIEARLDAALAPAGLDAEIGSAWVEVRDRRPVIGLRGVALVDAQGRSHLQLDEAEAVLSGAAALRGGLAVSAMRLAGLSLSARRDAEGRISLALGQETVLSGAPSPAAALAALREALARPPLGDLDTLWLADAHLVFADARRGRRIESADGSLRLARGPDGTLTLDADLGRLAGAGMGGAAAPGRARLEVALPADAAPASGRLDLRGVVPAGIAGIAGPSPLADLLARIDAPVSLTLKGGLGADGEVSALSGDIAVGAGRLRLPGRAAPVALERLRADLALTPEKDLLRLTGLDLAAGGVTAAGRLDLRAEAAAQASGIVAQAAFSRLRLDLPELFRAPVALDGLWGTARLDRETGAVEIGGLTAARGAERVTARGTLAPQPDGRTRVALDISAPSLAPRTLLALWPRGMIEPTRDWIARHIEAGRLSDVQAALRLPTAEGRAPVGLSFGFEGARVRPIPALAPIEQARGTGGIDRHGFSLSVQEGRVATPDGGAVRVSQGLVRLPDIGARDATLEVGFRAETGVASALALLSAPPFRPAGTAPLLGPGEAAGELGLRADLTIPLRPSTRLADVDFRIAGAVTGFASEALVPGRAVTADRLQLTADTGRVAIEGPATLAGAPLQVRYVRPLDPGAGLPAPARLTAEGALTEGLARAVGVALPGGVLSGAGRVTAEVTLPPGRAPELAVDGDLAGLGVALPGLGVSKPAGAGGSVSVSGRLGEAGRLETIRAELPGMTLQAAADLAAGGGLAALEIARIRLGRWLDASGRYRPGAGGAGAAVALTGGRLDLRYLPGAGGGGPAPARVDLALDRVVLSEGIALTAVEGRLEGGLQGRLSGRVNGAAPVEVRLARQDGGTAVQVTAGDAGAVLRAAGVPGTAQGGALDLRLVPAGGPGAWRGRLEISDISVQDAPAMAELLAALSVVGALEQLQGQGIRFAEVEADFRASRENIVIDAASATGNAIGLSLDGTVDLAGGRLDIQGVLSPIYFLNRAGSFLSRRGEGLLGISYTVTGPLASPRVRANPLSMLAPGFVRDIFRGRNERRSQPAGESAE